MVLFSSTIYSYRIALIQNNVKGKWQQKINSSHLKEIQKQCMETY